MPNRFPAIPSNLSVSVAIPGMSCSVVASPRSGGWKSTLHRVALLMAFLCVTGCESTKDRDSDKRDYVSLHQYDTISRNGRLDKQVTVAPNRYIYVRKVPVISSTTIVTMGSYRKAGDDYGLKAYLNNHGRAKWTAAVAEFRGRSLAVMIDGEFKQFIRIMSRPGEDTFLLNGGFTKDEAERIVRNAALNYFEREK